MGRVLWTVGEVVAGVLVAGLMGAAVVPMATRMGWPNGPWMLGVFLVAGLVLCVAVGERLRQGPRRA